MMQSTSPGATWPDDAVHDLDVAIAADHGVELRGVPTRLAHFSRAHVDRLDRVIGLDLGDAALCQQAAVVQHEDMVGELAHQAHVVLDHDDRSRCAARWPSGSRRSPARSPAARSPRRARRATAACGSLSSASASSRIWRSPCASCDAVRCDVGQKRITLAQGLQQRAAPAAQARPQQIQRAARGRSTARWPGCRRSSAARRPTGSAACARCRARRCGVSAAASIASPSKRTAPPCDRQLAGQHVEGRGLAGAIGADHAEDAGALDRQRQACRGSAPRPPSHRRRRAASCAAPSRWARAGASIARHGLRRSAPPALERCEDADQPLRVQQHDDDEDDRDRRLPRSESCRAARWSARRSAGLPARARAAALAHPPPPRSRDRPTARSRTAAASPGLAAARTAHRPIRRAARSTPKATAFRRLVSKPNNTTRRSLCASAAHSTPSGARYNQATATHDNDQRQRGHVVGGRIAVEPRQAGNALQAVEAAGHRFPVVGELAGQQRQRERDHREVRSALAATPEHQRADEEREQARRHSGQRHQQQQPRALVERDQREPRQIGRQARRTSPARAAESRCGPSTDPPPTRQSRRDTAGPSGRPRSRRPRTATAAARRSRH